MIKFEGMLKSVVNETGFGIKKMAKPQSIEGSNYSWLANDCVELTNTTHIPGNNKGPEKGFFQKVIDFLRDPMKASREKKARKAQIEAEEYAKYEAQRLEEKKKFAQNLKQLREEVLSDWQIRNKGKFEKRIYEDNTGDVILFTPKESYPLPANHKLPTQRGEYTLENFGINDDYFPNTRGQSPILIKHKGKYLGHFYANSGYRNSQPTFEDNLWHMHYTKSDGRFTYDRDLPDSYYLPREVTCLSCGYPGHDPSRHPGAVFTIEGHIPLQDMNNIKKNLVEKGIWKNYIDVMKTADNDKNAIQDARLAVYNEILQYLNK